MASEHNEFVFTIDCDNTYPIKGSIVDHRCCHKCQTGYVKSRLKLLKKPQEIHHSKLPANLRDNFLMDDLIFARNAR